MESVIFDVRFEILTEENIMNMMIINMTVLILMFWRNLLHHVHERTLCDSSVLKKAAIAPHKQKNDEECCISTADPLGGA